MAIPLNGTDAGTGYSELRVGGPINLGGGALNLSVGFEPPIGSSFEILTNTGSGPINGTFNGLNEGTIFSQGAFQFQITYRGGTNGNSILVNRVV